MSARIFQQGVRVEIKGNGGTPPIVCIEDKEHTVRACMAIRERRRREAMGVVTT